MANNKKITEVRSQLQPFLNSYTELLLDGLIKDKILQVSTGEDVSDRTYQLSPIVKSKISTESKLGSATNQFKVYENFKRVTFLVYSILNPNSIKNISLKKALESLHLMQTLEANGEKNDIFLQILNTKSGDINEEELLSIIGSEKLGLNIYINKILEFFTHQKVANYFTPLNYTFQGFEKIHELHRKVDIIGINEFNDSNLLFEIKYRKYAYNNIKDVLFQGYELLSRFDNHNKKENFLVLILYTDEINNTFGKLRTSFRESLEELFPGYSERLIFVPVSTFNLASIDKEFEEVGEAIMDGSYESTGFSKEPIIITKGNEKTINANFIKSPRGAFSAWVKLKSIEEYQSKLMNNQYVVSHSTSYKAQNVNGEYKYPNVFALSLTPNNMDVSKKMPTGISWRVWISNSEMENRYMDSPIINTDGEEWTHLVIRWDNEKDTLEFLVNGSVVSKISNYQKFWPSKVLDTAHLGTWGNLIGNHYMNVPMFRVISASHFLDDNWVHREQRRRPKNF